MSQPVSQGLSFTAPLAIRAGRPLLATKRVKFFTRSFSLELYRRASDLFQVKGIPAVRLTDQTADGYFYTMMADTTCDVAINVDEDAFIYDLEAVLDLAEYVLEQGYVNAGPPDCGPGCPRHGNPIVTNPFFNVFDLEKMRSCWPGGRVVRRLRYDDVKAQIVERFDCPWPMTDTDFDIPDCEPYYNFFFWTACHFRTLYLPTVRHADGLSTILFTPDGRRLCAHSWFSRRYRIVPEHTERISRLIGEVYAVRGVPLVPFGKEDEWAFRRDLLRRYPRKVYSRICGWPRKWRKWYDRWQRRRRKAKS